MRAFKELKEKFIIAPILATFNLELKIVLKTDVLDFVLEAYLGQLDKEGKLYSIAYYLRKLLFIELNYNVYDKELLAIVAAIE